MEGPKNQCVVPKFPLGRPGRMVGMRGWGGVCVWEGLIKKNEQPRNRREKATVCSKAPSPELLPEVEVNETSTHQTEAGGTGIQHTPPPNPPEAHLLLGGCEIRAPIQTFLHQHGAATSATSNQHVIL